MWHFATRGHAKRYFFSFSFNCPSFDCFLIQATDNLSLLTCVDFRQPAHLLHPLALRSGGRTAVQIRSAGPRHFELDPYPFAEPSLTFQFPARTVEGKIFASSAEVQQRFSVGAGGNAIGYGQCELNTLGQTLRNVKLKTAGVKKRKRRPGSRRSFCAH